MNRHPRSLTGIALVALAVLSALPSALAAQRRHPDFMFRTPRVSLSMRAGYALPTASSEIFDFTRQQLTVNRSDFGSATFMGELGIRTTDRLDVVLDLGYARSRTPSEFRDWVGTDDLPISQTTEYRRVPFTVGVKGYLTDRGRAIGRFAWIPKKVSPFVGASAGWVWYSFSQDGEFVDYDTYDIFNDTFKSEGSAPTLHVFAGSDWSLSPYFLLTGELRYAWARAEMDGDFVGFDRMDLSGFQATAGISVRF